MGHVDHGKTTLLDFLRHSNVAACEPGGITQSIGAFSVKCADGSQITFIDTPGHAAFTEMRKAGALATDIIVLVVSVVDGVQPQTVEVLKLAEEHHVPLVVAINKIDKTDKLTVVKDQLRKEGLKLEEDGGDVQCIPISALNGTNVSELLSAIQLQSALCELHTPAPCRAEVSVIDSKSPSIKNEVCGIVRCGTLKPGMVLVASVTYATVRKILNENGDELKEASVGQPVVLLGFKVLPKPGVTLMQVRNQDHAEKYHALMRDVTRGRRGKRTVPTDPASRIARHDMGPQAGQQQHPNV